MAPQALLDAPERPPVVFPEADDEARQDDRRLVIMVLVAAGVALVLGGGAAAALARLQGRTTAAKPPVVSVPVLTVDPPDGTGGVRPDAKVTVAVKMAPKPKPTAPTMNANPKVMPRICGIVRRKP